MGARTADLNRVGDPELLGAPVEDGHVVGGDTARLSRTIRVGHGASAHVGQERHLDQGKRRDRVRRRTYQPQGTFCYALRTRSTTSTNPLMAPGAVPGQQRHQ